VISVGASATTCAGASAAIRRSISTTAESNRGLRRHLAPESSPKWRKCGPFLERTLAAAARESYDRRGEEAGYAKRTRA
jgi:hypothetical protein